MMRTSEPPHQFGTVSPILGNLMPLLPRKGALAIAAVIDIALHARGRPVAAKSLATRHRLPPRHLEPVLQALVRHGILKGTRGPRGGYELAREQRRITADDILRAAGTADDINGTPLASSALVSKVVMPALGQAEHAFAAALARINVEDLAHSAAAAKGRKILPSTLCCIVCLSKVRLRWRQTRFSSAWMAEARRSGNETRMRFLCCADGVARITRRVCPVRLP